MSDARDRCREIALANGMCPGCVMIGDENHVYGSQCKSYRDGLSPQAAEIVDAQERGERDEFDVAADIERRWDRAVASEKAKIESGHYLRSSKRNEDQMSQHVCPKCGVVGCECVKITSENPYGLTPFRDSIAAVLGGQFAKNVDSLAVENIKPPPGVGKPKDMKECAERERLLARAREMTAKPEEIRQIIKDCLEPSRMANVSIWERVLAAALLTEQAGGKRENEIDVCCGNCRHIICGKCYTAAPLGFKSCVC